MSAKISMDLVRDSLQLASGATRRCDFLKAVESASLKEGANPREASRFACEMADGLGVFDIDGDTGSGDMTPTTEVRARGPLSSVTEGLMWGLVCLAGGMTVLNIGSGLIEHVAGVSMIVADCTSVGCFGIGQ